MTLRITGLDHIVLVCGDVEASIRFYCDELGL
jgi:catechol 2,3-dioxygenase-like lactoylglutathione lyase family enzyme